MKVEAVIIVWVSNAFQLKSRDSITPKFIYEDEKIRFNSRNTEKRIEGFA